MSSIVFLVRRRYWMWTKLKPVDNVIKRAICLSVFEANRTFELGLGLRAWAACFWHTLHIAKFHVWWWCLDNSIPQQLHTAVHCIGLHLTYHGDLKFHCFLHCTGSIFKSPYPSLAIVRIRPQQLGLWFSINGRSSTSIYLICSFQVIIDS